MNHSKVISTELLVPYEIEIHYKRPVFDTMMYITDVDTAVNCFRQYSDPNRIDHKEFFWAMYLSRANRVLGIAEIAKGNGNSVSVDCKEIMQLALKVNAKNVILCHTHPSGNLSISECDKRITLKIRDAARLMDMTLIDHIILTSESYTSFAQEDEL